MTDTNDPLEQATSAIQRSAWSSPPAVSRLRSDIRSGENFLIASTGKLPDLFVGSVVVEWGYEVPKDRSDEFHKFLQEKEVSLASECPAGVAYRGTYGVFAQSDMSLGAYRTIWSFDSLAAFEHLAGEVAAQSTFGKLLQQLTAFRDESIGAARSQQIYHPAATAQRT